MRDGGSASLVVLARGLWRSLRECLRERFPYVSPDVLRQRLEAGRIVDEAGLPQSGSSPYQPLRWLWYYREVPDEIPVPFDIRILHRDAHLVVIDKPHFLASIPGGRYLKETALVRLRKMLDLPLLAPIHRLDRDTAGVMLFCVDPDSRGAYQTLFQSRQVAKEYVAVAPLRSDLTLPMVYRSRLEACPGYFTVREATGAVNSETRIELLREASGLGFYCLRPSTGHKPQLRAHMSVLGIPVCNDVFYPEFTGHADAGDFSRPLQLLARSIEFTDPFSGRARRFESNRALRMSQ